jgi:hypothetical protein
MVLTSWVSGDLGTKIKLLEELCLLGRILSRDLTLFLMRSTIFLGLLAAKKRFFSTSIREERRSLLMIKV